MFFDKAEGYNNEGEREEHKKFQKQKTEDERNVRQNLARGKVEGQRELDKVIKIK